MTEGKVFPDWNDMHSELWGHQPILLEHEMHKSPAFSMQAIEKLIDNYPRERCNLVKTGAKGSSRVWREGELGSLGGRQVIDAISRGGGLWLNMHNVGAVDPRFHQLVDQMFDELKANIPDFKRPASHQQGILVSSPDAEVYFHADLPGQVLVQIAGRKRVYIYPNTPPFIRPEYLEDVALFNIEVDIPYKEWYDAHATVIDIGPGQMLSWPVNAPHRVENLDTFSISMTISYDDQDIRRAHVVNLANGILRHRFGYKAKSRGLSGPSFLAKRVLQKLLRYGSWLHRERNARRPIEFRLDENDLGKIVDLPKAA